MSRPSLAWSLLTSAIHICQNLGIHRASILDKEKPAIKDLKYRLFWGLYVLEKSLALRLGRASVLQDCDISLSRPDKREDGDKPWDGDGPWHICMAYTCEMASSKFALLSFHLSFLRACMENSRLISLAN